MATTIEMVFNSPMLNHRQPLIQIRSLAIVIPTSPVKFRVLLQGLSQLSSILIQALVQSRGFLETHQMMNIATQKIMRGIRNVSAKLTSLLSSALKSPIHPTLKRHTLITQK